MTLDSHDGGPPGIPRLLREKLEATQLRHQASVDALHGAVCEYTDDLRARGVSYENVILALRKLMADHDGDGRANAHHDGGDGRAPNAHHDGADGRAPNAHHDGHDGRASNASHDGRLVELMVEWCTEDWFKPR